VPDEVAIASVVSQFEIPVIRCQPLIEDLNHVDPAIAEHDDPRRLLAAMAGVALDLYDQDRVSHWNIKA
jgi:hypothetical protein